MNYIYQGTQRIKKKNFNINKKYQLIHPMKWNSFNSLFHLCHSISSQLIAIFPLILFRMIFLFFFIFQFELNWPAASRNDVYYILPIHFHSLMRHKFMIIKQSKLGPFNLIRNVMHDSPHVLISVNIVSPIFSITDSIVGYCRCVATWIYHNHSECLFIVGPVNVSFLQITAQNFQTFAQKWKVKAWTIK